VIPPPSYIMVAHANGVKILGTIVCEAGKGEDELSDMLNDCVSVGTKKVQFTVEEYANKFAHLAKEFGFDGYLLNFEVNVNPYLIPKLISFLIILRAKLKELNPNAQLIWYDSVTESGMLSWQSQLNKNNSKFFDVTDGIFLDYHWSLDYLKTSEEYAKDRSYDVYFGNDIYGRGTYGGGQLHTSVAVNVIC
jgi:mannosyl-glycoprotein endo-beta-N-acetylglucosaminidase